MKITNETEYRLALKRIEEIFEAELNTPEGTELDELVSLVELYEEKEYSME